MTRYVYLDGHCILSFELRMLCFCWRLECLTSIMVTERDMRLRSLTFGREENLNLTHTVE